MTQVRTIHPGADEHALTPLEAIDDPVSREAVRRMRERNPKADPMRYLPDVPPTRIPRHIAIIMDGNGRWARSRGFPRQFGHRNGARAVRETLREVGRLGIDCLTLFSFSAENWRRPREEVEQLMLLYVEYMAAVKDVFVEQNIRLRQLGRRKPLPPMALAALDEAMEATRGCTGPTLCLAVNYGSRAEIVDACRRVAKLVEEGRLRPDQIDEAVLSDHLDTAGLPDPDLLIRTAGEMRLSNYLLWQISYAELYVTETLWPDFDAEALHEAIRAYARRERRFGGVEPSEVVVP